MTNESSLFLYLIFLSKINIFLFNNFIRLIDKVIKALKVLSSSSLMLSINLTVLLS